MRTTIPQAANQPLGTVGDPPTAASMLTVTDAPGTPTIKKNGEKRKFLLRLLVCTAIFSWLFFGWPQIRFNTPITSFSFPPEIQVAEAAATLTNVATATDNGDSTSITLNFGWTATAGRLLVLTATWDKVVTGVSESSGTWT